MKNIKFNYLYRDGANYKNFGEVIFQNSNNTQLREIENKITSSLIDSTFFIAVEVRIPDKHFEQYKWNEEIDHAWHEFHSVEVTIDLPTDICNRTIEEFIDELISRQFNKF